MKKCTCICWILFGAILLIASDYRIKTVKVLPVESYPARMTLGNVTIALDPYFTDRKSYRAFDIRKLNSQGYFPLHVIIQNESKDFLKIQPRNIILVIATGQHLYTTPSTILLEDVVGAGLTGRIPIIRGDNPATSPKEGTPYSDFTSKELTNRLVDPGTVSDGFLFFFTPSPKENLFVGSTLFIPKLEAQGAGQAVGPFTIPLNPALPSTTK